MTTEQKILNDPADREQLLYELRQQQLELERQNEELRKSRESYSSFVSQSHEAIYCTEFDRPIDISLPVEQQIDAIYQNAYMAECNQAMAAMYGLPSIEAFIGQRLVDFHGGPDNPINRAAYRKFIENNYRTVDSETEEMTPDGEKRFFLSNDIGIVENGYLLRIWGTAIDITERKRMEEALRESEAKYRLIVENITDLIVKTDLEGRFLFASPSYCRLFGQSEEQLLGHTYTPLVHEDDLPGVEKAVVTLFQPPYQCSFEERAKTIHGWRWIEWDSMAMFELAGKIVALVGIGRDITERKRAEAEREKLQAQLLQAQKMESVGRLAGGVAHDFNNMLGVILGHTELALMKVKPGQPVYADLEEIRKAAERSASLTRQLLAFARQQTVTPQVLDLNETVAGMLTMLRRLIGEDINLLWLPAAQLWPVKIDPTQIDQILANLCVNARDAIAGVGRVVIETKNEVVDEDYVAAPMEFSPGDYVVLAVSDDGCGIDQETQAHLFEPFFTTKAVGQGTGLGLATVYGVVKQNNGFINVYSEPGQGTTFKIYLPRYVGPVVQAQRAGQAESPRRGQETILLVEDEPMVLELGWKMLTHLGYKVLSASSPDEAIRLAEAHTDPIDLLMTDVIMPEMNGRELARRLLVLYPALKRLFMSGYTANVITHHGILGDRVNFIQKPFSMQELAAAVRMALDQP